MGSQPQWYYSVDGKVSGPYSEERFFEVFHGPGSPGKEALVRKEAEGPEQWILASEVEGLIQVKVKKSLLPASVREAQAAPPPPVSVYLQPPTEERPRSRLPLVFLGVVAGLALIAGGVFAAQRYLAKKKPPPKPTPPAVQPVPAKPTPAKPQPPQTKPPAKPTPAKPQPAKPTPAKPTAKPANPAKPPAKPATTAKPQPTPAKTTPQPKPQPTPAKP